MNPVHITITLILTYLLRPVPSDVQLCIPAVHIMTFFDCRADLVKVKVNVDLYNALSRTHL